MAQRQQHEDTYMIIANLRSKFLGGSAAVALGAAALLAGSAVVFTALEAPAAAQTRIDRDRDRDRERNRDRGQQAADSNYSEGFVNAFRPAVELQNATPRDGAAMRALVPSIAGAISTPDDRLAGGQFIYSAGVETQDQAMQLQGLNLMLESGKVAPANLGQINFVAGQLAFQAEDWQRARQYLTAAAQAGYTENDPTLLIVETHLKQGDTAGGLAHLSSAVDQQLAAGQTPSEDLLRKGLATAYTGQINTEALKYAQMFARYYPAADSWGDAIVVTRAATQLTDDDTLDLLRLQRRTNTFRDGQEYLAYVEFADPRRLPNEVRKVIEEGYASGLLDRGNSFASEALSTAQGRQAQVTADLAGLERDARAGDARLATVLAAGNVLMDAGQPQKAEEFYRKAATMPGADTATALTRLGIAQVEQGKYAEAAATFEQVQGARSAVPQLWAIYARQQGGTATGG